MQDRALYDEIIRFFAERLNVGVIVYTALFQGK